MQIPQIRRVKMIKDDDDFLPPRLSVPDAVRPLTRGVEVEGSRGDGGFKR